METRLIDSVAERFETLAGHYSLDTDYDIRKNEDHIAIWPAKTNKSGTFFQTDSLVIVAAAFKLQCYVMCQADP